MRELQARLEVPNTTDMTLIVSPGRNEIGQQRQHWFESFALDCDSH